MFPSIRSLVRPLVVALSLLLGTAWSSPAAADGGKHTFWEVSGRQNKLWLFGSVHLLNTFYAVFLPQVPTAVAVFVFKQFFDGLPKDLDEAARIDGASSLRIYRQVIMPLSRPAVAAVTIFTFVTTWNNLLWPLLVLTNPDLMTIPVGLATVQGAFGIRYADTMATAILGALPLIAVFLLFQRNIVEGIAGTGLKG